jgi:hypothetical protein
MHGMGVLRARHGHIHVADCECNYCGEQRLWVQQAHELKIGTGPSGYQPSGKYSC